MTKVEDGETTQLMAAPHGSSHGLSNINWANSAYQLAYNRKVNSPEGPYFQIFSLSLSDEIHQ
ncbi:hypothetical protein V8V91_04740 [Algoriphagus halophilus]|uniref:hypothetical protein n=1 Tax=Algoriphagus halophilus TaxID=226505 RepID=UPI00358E9932